MNILSLYFALFVLVTFIIYWLIPNKYRYLVLLVANYLFYLFNDIRYIIILFTITIISYLISLKINKNKLIIGIVLIVSSLYIFKYLNFTIGIINSIFSADYNYINIILPLGISFYSFEAISYMVDVYNGQEAEKNFLIYATYISYFPTIIAGPIEKSKRIINQFSLDKNFNSDNGIHGLKMITWGLFEKIVVADNIASYINPIFNNVHNYSGLTLLAAVILFSIQIYADFAGYSYIAKGISELFAIDLMDNFKQPYFSTTIKEFWSKWHISLSSWLKEYIYIPLGGNRCGKVRHLFNLLITFIISGLWHGANITFLIWGLLHGLLQIIENVFQIKKVENKYSFVWWVRCIFIFVILCITWVFFRSNNINDALYILNPMNYLNGINNPFNYLTNAISDLCLDRYMIMSLVINLLIMCLFDYYSLKTDVISCISKKNKFIKYIIYILMIIIILSSKSTVGVSFVYDQF